MILRKSVRAKWVAALRSGEYQQTTGVLTEVNGLDDALGYCCLGVLCELARADGVPLEIVVCSEERAMDDHFEYVDARAYNGSATMPPLDVAKWAGSFQPRYEDWRVRRPGTESGGVGAVDPYLANENDSGRSFKEIADLIENDLDAEYDTDD